MPKHEMLKNNKTKFLTAATAGGLATVIAALCFVFFLPPLKGKQTDVQLPLQTAANWSFAVIGDSLLNTENQGYGLQYKENTRKALQQIKQKNIQLILATGGLTESGKAEEYELFLRLTAEAYADGPAPVILAAQGQNELASTGAIGGRGFKSSMDTAPFTHSVINGLHFITLSANKTTGQPYSAGAIAWLERQLKKAESDASTMPIFVIAPLPASNTIVGTDGSETAGSNALQKTLSKHHRAVLISGNSLRPQIHERMIDQNTFTAIGAQGLSRLALDERFFDPLRDSNTAIPVNLTKSPYFLIFTYSTTQLNVIRWNVSANTAEDNTWRVRLPFDPEKPQYGLNTRQAQNASPTFPDQQIVFVTNIKNDRGRLLDGVSFSAASDDAEVVAYEIETINWLNVSTAKQYAADSFAGKKNSAKTVTLALDPTLPSGDYTIRVYAIDAFGAKSGSFLQATGTHKKLP
ncbi:MAG: metallophosphoesterase [Oscillospiraceae bacterium]|jgi:hypothetical protein|nr:metallophosphoesterase [Oscillospiraceae bacterium]